MFDLTRLSQIILRVIALVSLCVKLFTDRKLQFAKEHFRKCDGVVYLDANGSVILSLSENKNHLLLHYGHRRKIRSPQLPIFKWVSNVHTVHVSPLLFWNISSL